MESMLKLVAYNTKQTVTAINTSQPPHKYVSQCHQCPQRTDSFNGFRSSREKCEPQTWNAIILRR